MQSLVRNFCVTAALSATALITLSTTHSAIAANSNETSLAAETKASDVVSTDPKSDTTTAATSNAKTDADASISKSGDTAASGIVSTQKSGTTLRLRAEVVDKVNPELDKSIEDLTASAIERINRAELLAKEKHYKNKLSKLVASGKDLAELATAYKGFEQSSEAADIILEEKQKLKSDAAVKYLKQKQIDEVQERIITALMQIATGMGAKDDALRIATIADGTTEIESLTTKEEAQKITELMNSWSQLQKPAFPPPLAGPMQIQAECKDVVKKAVQADAVVKDVTHSLHKYNGRSKFARTTAKVVNTTLSIAELSPTFISPAAQVAWAAYIMTQGGPEESKLLKEVYMAKRFENRFKMLNAETTLAVNSYNSAVLMQNAPLMAFSQFVISRLCEPTVAPTIDKNGELAKKKEDNASKPQPIGSTEVKEQTQ